MTAADITSALGEQSTVDDDLAQQDHGESPNERADHRADYHDDRSRRNSTRTTGKRALHWDGDAVILAFEDAMRKRGLEPHGNLIADGKTHRCDVINDRRGRGDGTYCLHLDGAVPAGGFINYKDGLDWENWSYNTGHEFSPAERHEQKAKFDAARKAHEAERAAAQERAAKKAAGVWEHAPPLDQHRYLQKKRVSAYGTRLRLGCVIVPLYDTDGKLHNLQFISADGGKFFLKDSRVASYHYIIGDDRTKILIAEGFATAASIHMATGNTVVVAFNDGNLLPVAKAVRQKFSDAEIVICADDDHKTKGNPGIAKAHAAADAVDALLAVPEFGGQRGKKDTDFNDLHALRDLDTVKKCIEAAETPDEAIIRLCEKDPVRAFEWIDFFCDLRQRDLANFQRARSRFKAAGTKISDFDRAIKEFERTVRKGEVNSDNKAVDFDMSDDGLYCGSDFLSAPFEVLGRARDPDGNGWARWLRWTDEDGREHKYPVSDAQLHGDASALCGELAQRGLRIATSTKRRGLLVSYLNRADATQRVTTVTRAGWHDIGDNKAFVLPDVTIGKTGDEEVVFVGAQNTPIAARGNLQHWCDSIGKLTAGHGRAIFRVSEAFAAPLAHLVGAESGGFNQVGKSSTGKTSLTFAAASVWGRGDTSGFVRTWRSTANGLEAAAVLYNDLPLPLDELGVADPRDANLVVYTLTSGAGKGRASRDGTLKAAYSWRTSIVSTGEIRVVDKIAEGGHRVRAGQEVRILDIPADAGKGFGVFDSAGEEGDAKKLADAIKAAATKNYGTAGPVFVEHLMEEGLDPIADIVREAITQFGKNNVPVHSDGQVSRGADRFALVAAAGELAIKFGLVPWEPGSAKVAAERLFESWLDGRGGTGPAEVRNILEQVKGLIGQFGASKFEPLGGADRPVPDRWGWRRQYGGDNQWCILPSVWSAEFCKGFTPTEVNDVLRKREVLVPGRDGKSQTVVTVDGRSMKLYVVSGKGLEGLDRE